MKQSIGGTWTMALMIVFILLFVAFIILNINYSKTVRTKNEVINMIEKYEGLTEKSITLVNTYLKNTNYSLMGVCVSSDEDTRGVYGASDLESDVLDEVEANVPYYYCVRKFDGANTTRYYQVTLFYKFNLPMFGDMSRFMIRGITSNFQENYDSDYPETVN